MECFKLFVSLTIKRRSMILEMSIFESGHLDWCRAHSHARGYRLSSQEILIPRRQSVDSERAEETSETISLEVEAQ